MTGRDLTHAQGLIDFVDASPSPYHAVDRARQELVAAGFDELSLGATMPAGGRGFVARGGTLVAWIAPSAVGADAVFHLVGAHTDSPNLRLKPNPDVTRAGFRQLGVEVYGAPLLNSWLDRDLGLSGRVLVRDGADTDMRLMRIDRPLLRIPQLAIHLDREINEKGLLLNRQQHLAPFWATDAGEDVSVAEVLGDAVGADGDAVVAWDVMLHPVEGGRVVGLRDEFVSSARIDNQLSCYAGLRSLLASTERNERIAVLVLFDHEEVGSASDRGADGAFLGSVLERVWLAAGGDRSGYLRALATGACISADCAHATNPNYADRHEPSHTIALNGGPVLKVNSNLRYATDAETAAILSEACRAADVPVQRFVNRTDLACGSTIGPLTAAVLGIPTVDVGAPQLAMHSARELCGTDDIGMLVRALGAFLA